MHRPRLEGAMAMSLADDRLSCIPSLSPTSRQQKMDRQRQLALKRQRELSSAWGVSSKSDAPSSGGICKQDCQRPVALVVPGPFAQEAAAATPRKHAGLSEVATSPLTRSSAAAAHVASNGASSKAQTNGRCSPAADLDSDLGGSSSFLSEASHQLQALRGERAQHSGPAKGWDLQVQAPEAKSSGRRTWRPWKMTFGAPTTTPVEAAVVSFVADDDSLRSTPHGRGGHEAASPKAEAHQERSWTPWPGPSLPGVLDEDSPELGVRLPSPQRTVQRPAAPLCNQAVDSWHSQGPTPRGSKDNRFNMGQVCTRSTTSSRVHESPEESIDFGIVPHR